MMDSVVDGIFEADKQNELLSIVSKILSKSKSLSDYCSELRDLALSRDTETRRNALNELAFVVINLPTDFLTEPEVKFLLDFFSARFADSGHSADLLVTAVHFLIFVQKTQDENEMDALFHSIFDDNGVQAYVQSDREKLLEIFEYFAKKHFYVIERMGVQFYTIFANAAGGERDPRCLIRVFSIFVNVMGKIDLGALMEEVFELVACYWPIEYQPKTTDNNPLTREALSAACDACLLSNRGFSLYTYQLIAEKLVEDDESTSHDKKLEACKLLSSACQKFGSSSLEPFLSDLLAGFRMLCLNPKNHTIDSETVNIVGDALKSLLETVEKEETNAEKIIKEMATSMLENCEPFVIQPEMGLSVKGLCLLEKMLLANGLVADIILPRVFYWINVLITGSTIKNQANKDEIIEETLGVIPKWFSMAQTIGQIDTNQTNVLLATLRKMQEYPLTNRLKVLCDCSSILTKFDANLSEEGLKNVDETILLITALLDDYDPILRLPIFNFLFSYSSKWFDKCAEIISTLESTQKWSRIQFLLCASIMVGSKQVDKFLPTYLKQLHDTDYLPDGTSILLLVFNSIKNQSNMHSNFEPLLSSIDQTCENEKLKVMGAFLQNLGLLLDKESREKLIELCIQRLNGIISENDKDKCLSAVILFVPICLQCQDPEVHKKLVIDFNAFLKNEEQLSPYILALYFAYHNRSKNECEEIEFPSHKWESQIAKYRSKMLTSTQLPTIELGNLFANASPTALKELLNFEDELTNPDKCFYRKTLMWAQRIITQFIPFFVKYYKRTDNKAMISLIIPTLRLAKRVSIPMISEFELLFPIIIEALHEPNAQSEQTLLLTNATIQLLQLTPKDSISADKIGQISYAMENFLLSESPNKVIFAALEVLELLARRSSSKKQLFRLEQILYAIRNTVQSKKRVIRQKAAHTFGLWEMIPI